MRNILIILLSVSWTVGFAQAIKPADLVRQAKVNNYDFQKATLFESTTIDRSLRAQLELREGTYELFELDLEALEQLGREAPEALSLNLPSSSKGSIQLELVKVNIFAENFTANSGATNAIIAGPAGLYYRGTIKGDPGSIAAFSIFSDQVRCLFSGTSGNKVLGKIKNTRSPNKYILYDDKVVLAELPFECGLEDDGITYTREELTDHSTASRTPGGCIDILFETDFDIFTNFESDSWAVFFYAAGLFNELATLYANDNINILFTQLIIWDSASPYSSNDKAVLLDEFQDFRTEFNADLGYLLTFLSSGGIAAGFDGLCRDNRRNSLCLGSIDAVFSSVPTYSWDVYVAAHELGHLLGSRHTHACVWNGNGTAIDGCSGYTEDSCSLPGNPSLGGTLMSYCHLANVGINFSLGFGPQPGNVIRNTIAHKNCIVSCGTTLCRDTLILTQDNFGTIDVDAEIEASEYIEASHIIDDDANAVYHAGDCLVFKPGFHAEKGSVFRAYNEGCTDGANLSVEEPSQFIETMVLKDLDSETRNQDNFTLTIAPNPFKDVTTFTFELEKVGEAKYSVFDVTGRLFFQHKSNYEQGYNQIEFKEGNELPPGIYFVKLEADGKVLTRKLVKSAN